ncbi:MAG: hypothetical protein AAF090_07430 [Bacteroidota bacterium]
MKTISILAAMAVGTLFLSCNNDDDNTPAESISGTWKIQNVSGGLQGVDIDYQEGDVDWTFDTDSQTVRVENRILTTGPEDIYAGPETGSYPYEVEQLGQTQILYLDDEVMGGIILSGNTLTVDSGSDADGLVTIFVR